MAQPIQKQLRRCVLPLMAVTGEARWVGIGTAFVVSVVDEGKTALMFTATHNLLGATKLEPYLQRATHPSLLDDFTRAAQPRLGSTKLYALTANGTPARMDGAWWRGNIDVAFLSATLPEDSKDRFDMALPIDTRAEVPESTTVIALVGLLVTCPMDSGMSGGPVVEQRNKRIVVRAVVSRSLSTEETTSRGAGDHGFVGLLLPALAIKAQGLMAATKTHGDIEEPTILDLIRSGVIEDLGRAHEWVHLVP